MFDVGSGHPLEGGSERVLARMVGDSRELTFAIAGQADKDAPPIPVV